MLNITKNQLNMVIDSLCSMGAENIILFGSYTKKQNKAKDIDLAVEGIPIRRILEADVAVHDILKVPVDLISREENPKFYEIIKDYGKIIYKKRKTHKRTELRNRTAKGTCSCHSQVD